MNNATMAVTAAHDSLARQGVSAGPVVAVLAVITLVAIAVVMAVAYLMYLRDRR